MSSVVPEGWVRIDLEEGVSALISGQSPNRKENRATGDAFGILKTTAIDWGRFDEKQNQEVLDDYEPNNKHLVLENDILITKAGPTHRVGVVAQARNLRSNVLLSGKMTALRVNDRFTPDFLTYALCQEEAQNHLKANTTGMASSQTNFTHDALLRVPILSPPLPEQKKIASILTSVDEVIENTQKQIDKLQDLKKATMNELLTKGIGHTEFKDSELGRIPKSWEVSTLGDMVLKITDGEHLSPDIVTHGKPILSAKDIREDGVHISGAKFVEPTPFQKMLSRCNPEFGDVLVVSRGATIGRVTLNNLNIQFALMGSVILIKPAQEKLIGSFISLCLESETTQSEMLGLSGSSAQQAIYLKDIKSLKLPVPRLIEQNRIASLVKSIDDQKKILKSKLAQTQSLKKSLMQDLLTGKVRVTVN